jgi:tetratricopeptide (TPR) repeat protein
MLDKEDTPDIAAIRKLLTAAFTPGELRRFCEDRRLFRPIVALWGGDHVFADMVDIVIRYCERRLLWSEFLAEVKQENPRQYARFEPGLVVTKADRTAPNTAAGQAARADRPVAPALKTATAYYNRAIACRTRGDWAGAIDDYSHAIDLNPNYAKAYLNRGVARAAEGDPAGAIADYGRAMELDPNYASAQYNTACAYAHMADSRQACDWLAKAIALDPKYRAKARTDKAFDPIRHTACFQALFAKPSNAL